MFGNLRRLERGRVAPIRHRQVAGRPHELRATHRDVPPSRERQYPKMDGRPSPPFPSSSPPPSSEVTPRDPPPLSTPPTPRATSDGPARRAASSHASETRRRGEARGPDEWSRVACRTRGRRLAEPRAVGALPGVTDKARARGSRYPTSDCSQEKRKKVANHDDVDQSAPCSTKIVSTTDVDTRVRLTQAHDSGPSPSARGVRSHTRSRPPSRTVGHRSRSACVSNFDRSPIAGEPPVGHSRHASASIRQALSPSRRDGGRHAEHRGSRERAHLARRGARAIRPGAPRDFRA